MQCARPNEIRWLPPGGSTHLSAHDLLIPLFTAVMAMDSSVFSQLIYNESRTRCCNNWFDTDHDLRNEGGQRYACRIGLASAVVGAVLLDGFTMDATSHLHDVTAS